MRVLVAGRWAAGPGADYRLCRRRSGRVRAMAAAALDECACVTGLPCAHAARHDRGPPPPGPSRRPWRRVPASSENYFFKPVCVAVARTRATSRIGAAVRAVRTSWSRRAQHTRREERALRSFSGAGHTVPGEKGGGLGPGGMPVQVLMAPIHSPVLACFDKRLISIRRLESRHV